MTRDLGVLIWDFGTDLGTFDRGVLKSEYTLLLSSIVQSGHDVNKLF